MIDKKDFLLQSMIKAYIEHLEPIGSSQLKSLYDIRFSPATIRGYFKKLGDEGFLAQEHVSSGRTPTTEALKQYWTKKLNFKLEFVDEKNKINKKPHLPPNRFQFLSWLDVFVESDDVSREVRARVACQRTRWESEGVYFNTENRLTG